MSQPGRDIEISRRSFVTAAAAAAPFTLANFASPAGAWVGGGDTIKVGLVGCGGRGTGAASQALNADPGVRLVALGDVFPDKLESSLAGLKRISEEKVQVDDDHKFIGFDAYKQVVDAVDVVLLATPPHFRPDQIRYAVEKGKHIFTEKPMAVDAPGVRSVLESCAMAKKKNLSVVAGFCWRYDDPNRQAFKRIHDGQIGDVVAAYTTYNAGVLRETDRQPGWTDMEYQLRNWWYYTWLSGDHIAEQACHSIDKINWAMNNKTPKRAVAIGGRQARNTPNSGHVWDHFGVTFEYDDGSRGFHMCRQLANCANDNSDYILGTEGNCFVNGWGPTQVIKGKRPWRYKKAPRVNMYQQEHNELFASIRKGEPINDGEWMMQSTMMSILGRMAAYTGQTITWEQAMNSKERLGPETYSWGEVAMPEVAIPGRHKFV